MRSLTLALPWPPSVNHYWRSLVLPRKNKSTGRSRPSSVVLISEEGRRYRQTVAKEVTVQHVPGMRVSGRLAVHIDAFPPDRRARDIDNLPKALLDSIKHAGVIRDDADIDDLRIVRGEVRKGGAVRIVISEIDGETTTDLFAGQEAA